MLARGGASAVPATSRRAGRLLACRACGPHVVPNPMTKLAIQLPRGRQRAISVSRAKVRAARPHGCIAVGVGHLHQLHHGCALATAVDRRQHVIDAIYGASHHDYPAHYALRML